MRFLALLLFMILLATSCEKEISMAKFRLELKGFELEHFDLGEGEEVPAISHSLVDGLVIFMNSEQSFSFETRALEDESHYFELPEGEYQMKFRVPQASLYGQKEASYSVPEQSVLITNETELLAVEVEANCAMFLVYDEYGQLDQGVYMLERHSYANGFYTSYPLYSDTLPGLYYTYFTPDPEKEDPSAFLWFFDGQTGGEEGGIPTTDLVKGYQYNIRILN